MRKSNVFGGRYFSIVLLLSALFFACSGGTNYVGGTSSMPATIVAENYTVTFSTDGGSEVAAQTVESEKNATEPTAPTKDGFTFCGWYTDSALTSVFSFSTAITSNITLYAKWISATVPTFEVTFEANGGSAVTKQVVASGEKASEPTAPTKTGATFGGWYADSGLTGTFDFNTAITSSTTLYAKWTYSVTVDGAITGGTVSADKTTDISSGETVTLTVGTNTGYKLKTLMVDGTDKASSVSTGSFAFAMPEHDVTVSATFVQVYAINIASTITGGTVTAKIDTTEVTEAEAGETVILTATPSGTVHLKSLKVDGVEKKSEVSASGTYSFTMPSSAVSVDAEFGYFGTKVPGEALAVGDIVFNDGSAEAYSDSLTLTTEQQTAAIAVIFDATSKKGVGLRQGTGFWAAPFSDGCNNTIAGLVCIPSAIGTGKAGDMTVTFTGATDGSTSLTTLQNSVSDYSATKYSAWAFVEGYATTAGLTGTYTNGWYMPSIAELCKLYQKKDSVNNTLGKITGATQLSNHEFWSSSQYADEPRRARTVRFENGTLISDYKESIRSVCVIHQF